MNEIFIIAPIAIVISIGKLLSLSGLVSHDTFRESNSILYWVSLPAMLFRMTAKADLALFDSGWNLFIAAHASYFILPFLAWGLGKLFREERKRLAISALVSMRSNQVFMGMPAISMALGKPGLEALSVFLAMSQAGYQLLSVSSSQFVLSGRFSMRSILEALLKLAQNPLIIACLTGVLCAFAGLNDFPEWIDTVLRVLGDVGTGLALMALGSTISLRSTRGLFRSTWRDCTVKLIFHPLITLLLLIPFPVDRVMMQVVVLTSAMPVAVNSLALSQGMGLDEKYAGEMITSSTILSAVTLPLWIRLLGA